MNEFPDSRAGKGSGTGRKNAAPQRSDKKRTLYRPLSGYLA